MRVIKALNNYFFDEDTITVSDGLWFYGICLFIILISVTVWFL